MTRGRFAAVAATAIVVGLTVAAAAPRPGALAKAAPGLWEIAGVPGTRAPARECVGDTAVLAQFEHRSRPCSRKVLVDGVSNAVVDYSCGGRDFGRSKLTVLTPRSLRIETQGISDGMPFNYVLQARRAGECPNKATVASH
jgi:hypothetical protein